MKRHFEILAEIVRLIGFAKFDTEAIASGSCRTTFTHDGVQVDISQKLDLIEFEVECRGSQITTGFDISKVIDNKIKIKVIATHVIQQIEEVKLKANVA